MGNHITTPAIDKLLSKLDKVREHKGGYLACCPAHDDRNPSLSVSQGDDGRILVHCHAGCSANKIVQSVGLEVRDLFSESTGEPATSSFTTRPVAASTKAKSKRSLGPIVQTYDYRDEAGNPLFQATRHDPKDFRQRRPDGRGSWIWNLNGVRLVPYRLPELLAANPAELVFIVEGEKDVETLVGLGLIATCNPMGAEKWRDEFSEHLRGRTVVIIADDDEPGRKHAQQVKASLAKVGVSAIVVSLPGAKDASEWVEKSFGDAAEPKTIAAELRQIIDATPFETDATSQAERTDTAPAAATASDHVPTTKLRIKRASEVIMKPVAWLWPERFPLGKLSLLFGDPDCNKSTMLLTVAAHVTNGWPWPDGTECCEPGDVIVLQGEDGASDTVVPRLSAAGADLDRVHLIECVEEIDGVATWGFQLDRHLRQLEQTLEELPDARLVIVDPVGAFMGSTDTHKNSDVRQVLSPLGELAERRNVAIIMLNHMSKATSRSALCAVTGSHGFGAAVRAAHLVCRDPDDERRRLFVVAKSNLGRSCDGISFQVNGVEVPGVGNHPRITWTGEPVTMTADELVAKSGGGGSKRSEDAAEWLAGLDLENHPRPTSEVQREAEQANLSWSTVKKCFGRLGIKSFKQGIGPGSCWCLRRIVSKETKEDQVFPN